MWISSIILVSIIATQTYGLNVGKCGTLPVAREHPAVVYDQDNSIYVMGGRGYNILGVFDEILKYDVNTHRTEVVGHFPYGIYNGVAGINSAGDIFHLGGRNFYYDENSYPQIVPTTTIYKIPQNNRSAPVLIGHMAVSRYAQSAVTVKDCIYVFGGDVSANEISGSLEIEEYNMTSNTARVVSYLPRYLSTTTAIYDGQYAYILGGLEGGDYGEAQRTIIRFDPLTFAVEELELLLPAPLWYPMAEIVGNIAYVISGQLTTTNLMTLFDFNALTVSSVELERNFPREASSAYVKKQNRVYILGGYLEEDVSCIDFPGESFDCTNELDGRYPHPSNCSKFIICSNGDTHLMDCPANLHFNPQTTHCDYPDNAQCQYQGYLLN